MLFVHLFTSTYVILLVVQFILPLLLHNKSRILDKPDEGFSRLSIEFKQSIISVLIFTLLITGPVYLKVVRFGGESYLRIIATFLGVAIWSEITYYYYHVFMHNKKYMWMHQLHHSSKNPLPISSMYFSVYEKSITILVPIF